MDPLDHVRAGLDGIACAVCDGPVPSGSTQVLAHRDGLAFLQVDCAACGSTTLAFVPGGRVRLGDAADGPPPGEPVTADDVLDMHELLRGWRGSLSDLVGPAAGSDAW